MSERYVPLAPADIRAHKGKSFTGIAVTFMCHDGSGRFFMTRRGPGSRGEPRLLGFREVFRTAPDGAPTHWPAFANGNHLLGKICQPAA